MITKEAQLKNTEEWVSKFKQKIQLLEQMKAEGKGDIDTDISISVTRNEIAKLERQVAEYKSLTSGSFEYIHPKTIEDLPETLIKLRLALNWSQKKLAEESGLDQQAISRYETNDYEGISFNKLLEILDAFKAHICIEKFKVMFEDKTDTIFQLPSGITPEKAKEKKEEIKKQGTIIPFAPQLKAA